MTRVYVIPVFKYRHAKDPDSAPRWGVMVNLKRMMPQKAARFEGLTSFFGGAMEPGDASCEAAAVRELAEEMGMEIEESDLTLVEAWPISGVKIYSIQISTVLDDARIRVFMRACTEGLADVLIGEEAIKMAPWMLPGMAEAALKAMQSAMSADVP